MKSIQELLQSGTVQINDRRDQPRFRLRSAIQVVAVDVVGAIVPTDIPGWTVDLSSVGAVITIAKRLTTQGAFVRFGDSDELVMPCRVLRLIGETRANYTYAVEFASEFDNSQLLMIFNAAEESHPVAV